MSSAESLSQDGQNQDQIVAAEDATTAASDDASPQAGKEVSADSADAGKDDVIVAAVDESAVDAHEAAPAAAAEVTDAAETNDAAEAADTAGTDESEETGDSEKKERPRIRLNPTVDATQHKAVPSLAPSSMVAASTAATPSEAVVEPSEPVVESSVSADAEPEASKSDTPPPVALPPVALPPKGGDLDAAMEAEIEQALSSGQLDVVTTGALLGDEGTNQKEPLSEETLESGTKLTGKIQSIHGDDVFLDLGLRSPGVVPIRQFVAGKKAEVGQIIEVVVDRVDQQEGLVLVNLPKGIRRTAGNWDALKKGSVVDCMVVATNKGGLEVTVGSLRGFLPASQVDFTFVSDLKPFVGQKLRVEIVEANRKKRNLVVSRRAYLQIERAELEEELWKTLDVGQTFQGTVKTLKDYGAFVEIGGIDAFLHIGEISWSRIKHPSEVLQEGQTVDVKVLAINSEQKKISLGMRQLTQDPWTTVGEKFPAGATVSGKVTRVADFGAFVELETGIEGLVHISELDYKRVKQVSDVLKEGQQVDVKVLEVDSDRKRVSLSLKALLEKPTELKPRDKSDAEEGQPYQRTHKGPLKGGTGTTTGSGMFGNPSDFS